jgi:hypothetical protein
MRLKQLVEHAAHFYKSSEILIDADIPSLGNLIATLCIFKDLKNLAQSLPALKTSRVIANPTVPWSPKF